MISHCCISATPLDIFTGKRTIGSVEWLCEAILLRLKVELILDLEDNGTSNEWILDVISEQLELSESIVFSKIQEVD
jgi:hypothetical protein